MSFRQCLTRGSGWTTLRLRLILFESSQFFIIYIINNFNSFFLNYIEHETELSFLEILERKELRILLSSANDTLNRNQNVNVDRAVVVRWWLKWRSQTERRWVHWVTHTSHRKLETHLICAVRGLPGCPVDEEKPRENSVMTVEVGDLKTERRMMSDHRSENVC